MSRYVALPVDFEIPNMLEEDIQEFVNALNAGTTLADCYEQTIRTDLNCCDEDLTPEQDAILRDYYVRGGIYANVR